MTRAETMPPGGPRHGAPFAFVAAVAVIGLFWFGSAPIHHGLALAGWHVVLAIYVWRRLAPQLGAWGMVSPLVLVTLCWTALLAIPGLAAYSAAAGDSRLGFDPNMITVALAVSLGALVLIAAGFLFAHRRLPATLVPARNAIQDLPLWRPVVVLLILGLLARVALVQQGVYGYLSFGQADASIALSLLRTLSGLLPLSVAAATLLVLVERDPTRRRRATRLLVAAALPVMVFGLVAGLKAQIFTDLTPAMVVYVAVRRRLPVALLAALAGFLVLSYVGVETYRSDIAGGVIDAQQRRSVTRANEAVVARVVRGVTSEPVHEQALRFGEHFTDSFSGIARILATVIHRTPDEIPHLGYRRLLRGPLFFVPGGLVSPGEKPIGQYVNQDYLDGTVTSSAPPTQPGDLFISGGWPAVVVGQFLVGLLLGVLWWWVLAGGRERLIIYAALSPALVNAGTDVANLMRGMLQGLVAYSVLTLVIFGRAGSLSELRAVITLPRRRKRSHARRVVT